MGPRGPQIIPQWVKNGPKDIWDRFRGNLGFDLVGRVLGWDGGVFGEQTSNFFLDFWPSGGPSRPWEYFAGTRIGILHPYMVSNLDLKPWQASGGSFTRNMVPSIGTSDPWLGLLGLPCLGLAWLASQPGSSLPTATTTRPPSAGGAALRSAVFVAVGKDKPG